MKILVVAAHPDDEVLGCGGTILKQVENSQEVFVCIITNGKSLGFDDEELERRRNEALDASSFLGVKETFFLDFPSTKLDTVPIFDLINRLKEIIDSIKPDVIYTHFYKDLMQDHAVTSNATLIACKSAECIKEIYLYEVPSSSGFNFGELEFKPNVFVDISQYIDKKIKALNIYKSEIMEYPNPRSDEGLRIYAEFRGLMSKSRLAEAFMSYVQWR